MNILTICENDWLKNVVFDLQITAELLSLRGHKVYAIDFESKWQKDGSLISKYKELDVARAYQESSVKLIRPAFIKVPVLSRASAWVTHWRTIAQTIEKYDIDAILLYSVPTNGIQTVRIANSYDIPVIFRSIDVLNQLVPNKILSTVTRILEKEVYSQVDLILTINNKLAQYVIGMGAYKNKVKVLPLGVDTEAFKPIGDTSSLRHDWGIKESDKVILFVGTLPKFSGLDRIIRLFPKILKEVPEAKLLIVGDGVQRDKLDRIIIESGLSNKVLITGYQPHDSIPQFINMAYICIMPFDICGATRDIFPTKVIQYMACGKPVVSTPLHGLVDTISMNQGIWYANNDEDMIGKITLLLKSNKMNEYLGNNALEYVRRVHSYDNIIDQLDAEFVRLLQ